MGLKNFVFYGKKTQWMSFISYQIAIISIKFFSEEKFITNFDNKKDFGL